MQTKFSRADYIRRRDRCPRPNAQVAARVNSPRGLCQENRCDETRKKKKMNEGRGWNKCTTFEMFAEFFFFFFYSLRWWIILWENWWCYTLTSNEQRVTFENPEDALRGVINSPVLVWLFFRNWTSGSWKNFRRWYVNIQNVSLLRVGEYAWWIFGKLQIKHQTRSQMQTQNGDLYRDIRWSSTYTNTRWCVILLQRFSRVSFEFCDFWKFPSAAALKSTTSQRERYSIRGIYENPVRIPS